MIPSRDFVLDHCIDLPRSAWHYSPPSRWRVVAILAGIVATAILLGVL